MTIEDLMAVLSEHKVTLFVIKGALRYRAPAGALTIELREGIAGHRLALIERLRHVQQGKQADVARSCVRCDRTSWVDEPPKEGRIRTTCGKCGKFIGYCPESL